MVFVVLLMVPWTRFIAAQNAIPRVLADDILLLCPAPDPIGTFKELFNFTHQDYARVFKQAARMAGMGALGHTPYACRHGGPSHDRLLGDDLAAIQKRGRWRHPRSVERYEKAGRMPEAVASLPAQVLNFHSLCAAQILPFLQSPDAAPPSPCW